MAAEEDFWYFDSEYFLWFGILWIFEILHVMFDAIAFVLSAGFFFDDSGDESGDCFDHDHGWGFPAERDEVSERNFLKVFFIFFFHILLETVVYTFISGADKNYMI